MEYSGSRATQRMSFCNHVGLLLVLTFSICVPGALGSGHSHLRSRKLLAAAFPSPAKDVDAPQAPPPPLYVPFPVSASPPPGIPESLAPPPPALPALLAPPLPPPSPPSSPPTTAVAPSSTWNESEKAGVVIAAIAALLQVAVAAFLLVKRRQMLAAVDYEDFDNDYDHHSDANYRRSEHSA